MIYPVVPFRVYFGTRSTRKKMKTVGNLRVRRRVGLRVLNSNTGVALRMRSKLVVLDEYWFLFARNG